MSLTDIMFPSFGRAKRSVMFLARRQGTVALHTGLTDEGWGRTVIYSDDLGVGLGPMLGNCVGQRCMKNKELEVELFIDSANSVWDSLLSGL
ncbi:hypothetical protein EVAR_6310_1 [Eumeta japonica]|uniref:Uncharacterized protein n=1 Tax=Eumeta variegata TaxID=151549 RepID=A0A4C1T9E7_EUMVA|nr:hypothetical protein EVAR_6310_1 [Eumeta japonica]